MIIWFLVKRPRQFHGERIVFSTNEAEIVGYPYVKKKKNLDFITHYIKKLTLNHRIIRPKGKKSYKAFRREHRKNFSDLSWGKISYLGHRNHELQKRTLINLKINNFGSSKHIV